MAFIWKSASLETLPKSFLLIQDKSLVLHMYFFVSSQALSNVDELFEREELSAAPDCGWPDCFNSGVFVFRPALETFSSLVDFARVHGSFDGEHILFTPLKGKGE